MSHGNVTMESLSKKAILVGKALNDPIYGLTSLRRVGVTFSDDQIKLITHLENTNHTIAAQKIVLRELRSEFGGSAKALGQTLPGQLNILREQLRNFAADALEHAIPVLQTVIGLGRDVATFIGRVAQAPSLKIGLDVAGAGLKDLGTRIKTSVQNAIGSVDWKPIGQQLGATIGSGLVFTDVQLGRFAGQLLAFVNAHAQQFATVGATLAVRMAATLLDPSFWAHHLVLLAVLITARFGGEFAGLLGRLGGRAAAVFVESMRVRAATIVTVLANVADRIPGVIAKPFVLAATLAGRAISHVATTIAGDLRTALSHVPGWIAGAFRIGAVVALWGAVETAIHKIESLWGWLKKVASQVWKIPIDLSVGVGGPGLGLLRKIPGASHIPLIGRQHGGFIPGAGGQAVPIMAHAGEMVLNRAQQEVLGGPRFLSSLFGFQGERGPSFAAGGRVAAPRGSTSTPLAVPPPPPSPLPALRRKIASLRAEERRLKAQLAAIQKQLSRIPAKANRAQPNRRKALKAEQARVLKRLKAVQAELRSLGEAVQEAIGHDYSELPVGIQLEEAQAALTEGTGDDLLALHHAESYLENQLRRPGITKAQQVQLLQALAGVRGQIRDLTGTPADTGGGGTGDTGVDNSADLQAQLDQANAKAAAASESARLANAFVATGVFSTQTPGAGGSSGSQIIVNSLMPPDARWISELGKYTAMSAGMQPFVQTSVIQTGF
jgi:hypothetical protein